MWHVCRFPRQQSWNIHVNPSIKWGKSAWISPAKQTFREGNEISPIIQELYFPSLILRVQRRQVHYLYNINLNAFFSMIFWCVFEETFLQGFKRSQYERENISAFWSIRGGERVLEPLQWTRLPNLVVIKRRFFKHLIALYRLINPCDSNDERFRFT